MAQNTILLFLTKFQILVNTLLQTFLMSKLQAATPSHLLRLLIT